MAASTARERGDPGPAPAPRDRRRLLARGHNLKAQLALGRQGLSEEFLAQVRRVLDNTDLVKVRIPPEDPSKATDVARELAGRVPCHLLQRVGRVVLLYRPSARR